ncbi:MAG: hypothetical protein JW850_23960 [Thermoflexales bacterium]|nr:hypothetical protein [Thermoflexales bacterium]
MANPSRALAPIYTQLIHAAQRWALRDGFDPARAAQLRHQAILMNHALYLDQIPAYRRFAQQEGIEQLDDVEPIKRRLMVPDDLFKSYEQKWLDERDFKRMNGWLSDISSHRIEVDVANAASVDVWIDRLAASGIRLICSSGTSGTLSFIPRDADTVQLFAIASACYITPLLLHSLLGSPLQRWVTQAAARWLAPHAFAGLIRKSGGMSGYDAVFLDFRGGRTGNQVLAQELAPLARKHYFLYETDLSPSTLRLITRGAKTDQDREVVLKLQELVVTQKEQNYLRVIERIRQSTADGQRVFIFGTPHQYKELCEIILEHGAAVALKPGSLVLFGGGWKSFSGQKIARDQLIALMSQALHLPPERILEGYSMIEINAFMLRCEHGRFHIPPTIEPVILNEELEPLCGDDLRGIFGFLDPLALAYPGYIISGDQVHFVNGDCPCGLFGAAVTEIGRAAAREVKGCGGIMASVAA